MDRVHVLSSDFELNGFGTVYATKHAAPSVAQRVIVPSPWGCPLSRVWHRMYWLTRVDPGPGVRWSVSAPDQFILVQLSGETLCFNMERLAFFESGLKLETIVNAQFEWACLSSLFVPRISGHGLVGFHVSGQPDIASVAAGEPERRVLPNQLIAWTGDSVAEGSCSGEFDDLVNESKGLLTFRSADLLVASRKPAPVAGIRKAVMSMWRKLGV